MIVLFTSTKDLSELKKIMSESNKKSKKIMSNKVVGIKEENVKENNGI